MGCDYYIIKLLRIYYSNNEYLDLELHRERGYYNYSYDEDEDDYEEKVWQYKKYVLTPEMNPIVIYNNNSFHKIHFEDKYKSLVETEINKHNKSWSEIIKIMKIEERYLR
jgi:hypothetical protein